MKKNLKPVSLTQEKGLGKTIRALYNEAFPKSERIPWPVLRFLTRGKEAGITAYFDGPTFCGFTVTACYGSVCYLMFFAVDGHLRGRGYGSRILQALKAAYPGKTLIALIEPLDDTANNAQQRKERLGFYARNGFYQTGYYSDEVGGPFAMLATAEQVQIQDYLLVFKKMTLGLWKVRAWKP